MLVEFSLLQRPARQCSCPFRLLERSRGTIAATTRKPTTLGWNPRKAYAEEKTYSDEGSYGKKKNYGNDRSDNYNPSYDDYDAYDDYDDYGRKPSRPRKVYKVCSIEVFPTVNRCFRFL